MRRAHVAIGVAQTRLDRVDRRRAGSIPPRWRAGSPAAAIPRFRLAADSLQTALEIDPGNQSVRTLLESCRAALGHDH